MTDTSIAAITGQGSAELGGIDEGLGSVSDGNERWYGIGYLGAMCDFPGELGVVNHGMEFTAHNGTNDTAQVAAGRAHVMVSSVEVQSRLGGGDPAPSFDTTLPGDIPVPVILPSSTQDLSLTGGSNNDVWVAIDTDGTGPQSTAGDIYLRYGTGLSAPSHPSLYLGTVDPDNASADTLSNRNAHFSRNISLDGNNITEVGGTTDASTGAIRLANNVPISWRNTANDGDVSITVDSGDRMDITGVSDIHLEDGVGIIGSSFGRLILDNDSGAGSNNTSLSSASNMWVGLDRDDNGTSEELRIGTNGDTPDATNWADIALFNADSAIAFQTFGHISLDGNNLLDVGGTTDANSGAIRMANSAYIKSRNSGNTGDIRAIGVGGGDNVLIGDGNETGVYLSSHLTLAGNYIDQVGGTTDANSGAIRMANNSWITARNSGNTADVNLLKVGTDDEIDVGTDLDLGTDKYIGQLPTTDTFTYDSSSVAHYGLGWHHEGGDGPAAYLTGFGGIRLFAGGFEALFVNGSQELNSLGNNIVNVGDFVRGDTTTQSNIGPITPTIQTLGGSSASNSSIGQVRYNNGASGPLFVVGHSRSGTVGSPGTAVQSGDTIYRFQGVGDDGTDLTNTATEIEFSVGGPVATDQVPGRIALSTATSAGSLTEALRINSNQQILSQPDGSSTTPAFSFVGDEDTGLYRVGTNDIGFAANGEKLRVKANVQVTSGASNLDLTGNYIQRVGGTTDASSGAIRMANGAPIKSRNSGNTGDIRVIGVGGADNVLIGDGNETRVRLSSHLTLAGNYIDQVGGTTDANSGAIRMANNSHIRWRNDGNTSDYSFQLDGNDNFVWRDIGGSQNWMVLDGSFLDLTNGQALSLSDAASDPGTNGRFTLNGTDVKVYSGGAVRNLSNIGTGGGFSSTLSGDYGSPVNVGANLEVDGNIITEVGGTTDASVGEIRLANGSRIFSRNSTNDGDFGFDFTDEEIEIVTANLKLPNSTVLEGRNTGDTADITISAIDGSDNIIIGDSAGNHDATILYSGSNSLIDIDGSDIADIGGEISANAGGLRLANTTSILARNAGDTADFGLDFNGSNDIALNNASLDFGQNEAKGMVLETVAGDPTSPVTGQIWYDTSAD